MNLGVPVGHLEELLTRRLAPAFSALAGAPVDPAVRRSRHTDFQSDAALALARRLGRPPRQVAADALDLAELADLASAAVVSGPGFINVTVADHVIVGSLRRLADDDRLGVGPTASPETVVVDYSGPNVAKEMHVGHLRSTVIGDATVRLLDWLGHRVIRVNHLGDWGTPFGMLIEHLLDLGEAVAVRELSIGDLDSFYRAARVKFDSDDAFRARAQSRVVALQQGDQQTRRLWRLLVAESERYFLTVYERLGVLLRETDFVGESRYREQLDAVAAELDRAGLLQLSAGAATVFPDGCTGRDGEPLPLIVRKGDGGYGYGATDLAALRHRVRDLGATRLLYVVGLPQQRHFELVYAVARQAGWLAPPVRAEHVGFGSVLGADGRMLRSRSGGAVKLVDLLDEAVARATELALAKNPALDPPAAAELGRAVGLGAIKYADLATDRTRDHVFDWQRMLSLDGNTAPYLQYAHARIRSIFRRAGAVAVAGAVVPVDHPAERALALELLHFGAVVTSLEESLEFHRLAGYLHTLAVRFNAFYEHCPVLRAEGGTRAGRLLLCDLTARVLRQGLHLLGIDTPDRM